MKNIKDKLPFNNEGIINEKETDGETVEQRLQWMKDFDEKVKTWIALPTNENKQREQHDKNN
jgi:hypothetical protein